MMLVDCGRTLRGRYSLKSTTERWATLAILVLWIGMVVATNLHAQNPARSRAMAVSSTDVIGLSLPTVQLPMRGVRAVGTGGMTCRVRFGREWVAGYVAAEIQVQALGKFAADREMVFRFRGVDDAVYPPKRNLVVDVPVMVRQGTALQTYIRYLPRWAVTREISIDVLEDGRSIPGFAAEIVLPFDTSMVRGIQQASYASFRYSKIALQSETRLDPLMVMGADRPSLTESNISQSLSHFCQSTINVHPLSRMPTDWRAYQQFDAIILSPSLCDRLAWQPDAFNAVRHWLMMGGTVIITGDSDPESVLTKLGLSDLSKTILNDQVAVIAAEFSSSWSQIEAKTSNLLASPPAVVTIDTPATSSFNAYGQYAYYDRYAGDPDLSAKENNDRFKRNLRSLQQAQARTAQQWSQRIWVRPVAAGQVLGLPTLAQTGTIEETDLDVIGRLIDFRVSPMLRRGVDPMMGDSRFGDWLIPGVAQPPVYTFIGLLTVFVILVGPVAYRQTTRHHRSHLMFLIAPLLAIITTVMMFAYGIVSDGFGTSVRIRQLTLVDGDSGTGVERIRSTYFAGVRPADGLRFGGIDEVTAYPETDRIAWGDHLSQTPQAIGRVTIGEDYQLFDSSFLPSRSQTQFVVHRPIPNIGSLRLNSGADKLTTITNGFDFPLRRIVVHQSENQYLTLKFIGPLSTAEAIATDVNEVSKKLGTLYNDFRPIMKASTESRTYQNSGKSTDLIREVMQTVAPQYAGYDGVFEIAFRDRLQTRLEIPVGHFVAISDISDDAVAVSEAEQVGCVRYIMGTLGKQESP